MTKEKKTVDKLIKWTAIADAVVLILLLLVMLLINRCSGDENLAETETIEGDTSDVVSHADEIGNTGDLKITLLWDFDGDIDLHVVQPNMNEIYYRNSKDLSTGGYLDVDNVCGGRGSAENIYWTNPPKGRYTVALFYYQASERTGIVGSGYCTVVIQQKGMPARTYSVAMSSVKEKKLVTTVIVE